MADPYVNYDPYTGAVRSSAGQALPQADRLVEDIAARNPSDFQSGVKRVTAGNYGGTPGLAQLETNRYQGLAGAADARQAPQMQLGAYNASSWMDQQRAQDQGYALNQYKGMIEGTGPSLAALQMQNRMGVANQQAAQMAAGARGGGAGLAAMQNASIMGAGQGGVAAMAQGGADRSGEVFNAMQGYGGLAQQQRSQDLARMGTSQDLAFKQAGLDYDQRARNDARNLELERMAQGVTQQQMAAQQWREFANYGDFDTMNQMAARQAERDTASRDAKIAAITSGTGVGLSAMGKVYDDKTKGSK